VKYLVGEQQVDPLCQDEEGYTSLHLACEGGDIDVVQYLISEMKKHTSLDSIVYDKTKAGDTAVHHAALKGHLPVVKLFITDLKFDPNTLGQLGWPPLIHAAQGGHLEVVRYLTEELQCDPSYAHGEDKATMQYKKNFYRIRACYEY
jgi:ankyrin